MQRFSPFSAFREIISLAFAAMLPLHFAAAACQFRCRHTRPLPCRCFDADAERHAAASIRLKIFAIIFAAFCRFHDAAATIFHAAPPFRRH